MMDQTNKVVKYLVNLNNSQCQQYLSEIFEKKIRKKVKHLLGQSLKKIFL